MQNSAGLIRYLASSQSMYYTNMPEKCQNNRHGDCCESGTRACPESVGVGKFYRLRLRLRLREKQPTPNDSDSDSDSDSAALPGPSSSHSFTVPLGLLFWCRSPAPQSAGASLLLPTSPGTKPPALSYHRREIRLRPPTPGITPPAHHRRAPTLRLHHRRGTKLWCRHLTPLRHTENIFARNLRIRTPTAGN